MGGTCSPYRPGPFVCDCQTYDAGSGVLCGVFGNGRDKQQAQVPLADQMDTPDWGDIYSVGFAFLNIPVSAAIGSLVYPTLAQQSLALSPQSMGTGSYQNDGPTAQSLSRTKQLSASIVRTWSSSSSFQQTFASKSSTSNTCKHQPLCHPVAELYCSCPRISHNRYCRLVIHMMLVQDLAQVYQTCLPYQPGVRQPICHCNGVQNYHGALQGVKSCLQVSASMWGSRS